jgi:hypothetical protein
MRAITKPGIYDGISDEMYHADPCPEPSLSHSVAVALLGSSPAHARLEHPKLNPDRAERKSRQMDLGKVLHKAFLEGEDIIGVIPDDLLSKNGALGTKAAKELAEAIRESGRIPLTQSQCDQITQALHRLRKRVTELDEIALPFTDGKPEQTLIWREDNGIWCRARPDWLRDDFSCMDELKSAASASPGLGFGQFGRAIWTMGYDIQAALYRRGLQKLTGQDARFRFVAVELDGHGLSLCELDPVGRAVSETKVARAIELWGRCMERGEWPGYPRYSVAVEAPAYELGKWETMSDGEYF